MTHNQLTRRIDALLKQVPVTVVYPVVIQLPYKNGQAIPALQDDGTGVQYYQPDQEANQGKQQ
jgi:lipase chaperone LimK